MQFKPILLVAVLSLCVPTSSSKSNFSEFSATSTESKELNYPSYVNGNCPFKAKRSCPVSLLAGRGAPSQIDFIACGKSCSDIPELDNTDVHAWTNGLWAKFLGFKRDFEEKPSVALNDFAKLEHLVDGMQVEEKNTFDLMKEWVNSNHVDGSIKALVKDTGHSVSNLLERAQWEPYTKKPWRGKQVVIVGGGPIGLRMAVEALLLGADVTVGENRDGWTRANVMKMWPVAKHDLESIGLKEFNLLSGDMPICNIALMQHALLRISMVLGANVEIMKFKELRYDAGRNAYDAIFEKNGKELPPLSFDAIFDASGVGGAVAGSQVNGRSVFNRDSDASGAKRVAITANFKRFRGDKDKEWAFGETMITAVGAKYLDDKQRYKLNPRVELRDLVWFQSVLSNYVVMALDLEEIEEKFPKIIKDSKVSRSDMLRGRNIDFDEMLKLVMAVVEDWKIPHEVGGDGAPRMLEGINKMAIFDFMGGTMSTDQESGSVTMIQKLPSGNQYVLAVGDALRAPFWPEGTGMSRGILSVLHAGFTLTKVWGARDASARDAAMEEAKTWAYVAAYAQGSGCKSGKCGAKAVESYVKRGYKGDAPPRDFGAWM